MTLTETRKILHDLLFIKAAGFRILYVGHPTPKNSIELLEDINDVYAPMQGRGTHK